MTRRAAELIEVLAERGLTLAVAESLTGGLLTSAFVDVPGASRVVTGGVIAYATELKASILHVDADLLEREGPVDPTVAVQLAENVRAVCSVAGRPADLGVSTTGVAGPDPQGGKSVGLAYVGLALQGESRVVELRLDGTRDEIRHAVVTAAVEALGEALGLGDRAS